MCKKVSLKSCLILAALLSLNVLTSAPALAVSTCNAYNGTKAIAAGALSIPANAAPGMVVKSVQTASVMQCRDLTGTNTFTNNVDLLPVAPLVAGYNDVYQTNISGLGVRYTFNAPNCTNASAVILTGTSKTRIVCPYSTGTAMVPYTLNANMDFVVTGTLPASATLTSASEIKMYYVTSDSGGPWTQESPLSGAATGTVTAATCSVNQKMVGVTLDPVEIGDLSSRVGLTAAPKSFNLSLTCPAGIKAFVTLTDNTNIANRTTTLGLTADSSAKGVGIQILNSSDIPVAFGPDSAVAGNTNQFLLGTSTGGATQYPFKAQYISTGSIRAGSVSAIATFTLSYQ